MGQRDIAVKFGTVPPKATPMQQGDRYNSKSNRLSHVSEQGSMPVNMVLTQQYAIDMLLNKAGKRSTTLLQLKAAVKHKTCFSLGAHCAPLNNTLSLETKAFSLLQYTKQTDDHCENNSPQPNQVSTG